MRTPMRTLSTFHQISAPTMGSTTTSSDEHETRAAAGTPALDPSVPIDGGAPSQTLSLTDETEHLTAYHHGNENESEKDGKHDHEAEPTEACSYCSTSDPASLARCGTCQRWFCNGSSLKAGSHIVAHLVHLKHSEISLHEQLALGGDPLECYNCGSRNVFALGFVAAKQELVVVLLCRMPCAQARDINWATNEWQPLVEARALLPWVAAKREPARDVKPAQMARLEAQWRVKRDATLADVDADADGARDLAMALLRYPDALEYQHVWAPLVEAEAACDKFMKELRVLDHLLVTWGTVASGRHTALFIVSTYETSELHVAVGDEVVLHHRDFGAAEWSGAGVLVAVPGARTDIYTVELQPSVVPPQATTGFLAEIVWKGTPYQRMQHALFRFATSNESVSAYVYHKILGHDVVEVEFDGENSLNNKRCSALNASQRAAVAHAIASPLTLIQGPPGTGKTVTSAAIVRELVRLRRLRVLVCAPSNVAVDHLALKLRAAGLKVVRLAARSREDIESEATPLALHTQVRAAIPRKVRALVDKQASGGELDARAKARIARSWRAAEQKLISSADVICTTCVGADDRRLEEYEFPIVLVDESTQATEPEALIPITRGAKQVVLVGDHQQLGPVVLDPAASAAGLRRSLFERLVSMGHVPLRLEVQYRMHPALSEFASNMFYEGLLLNGVTSDDRTRPGADFPWPVPDRPMMFWANYGKEEIGANGSSYLNRVEAMNVDKIIARLVRDGVLPDQIGVITPYEGQRVYIWQYLKLNSTVPKSALNELEVEVSSVDAFQGREKDYIILLCVRANEDRDIGFLKDLRRLNVALTRAKFGLIILGNPRSLSKNKLWNSLLVHYRERGCLVEGPLDNLNLSLVPLGQTSNQEKLFISGPRNTDFDTQSMISHVVDGDDPEFHYDAPQELPLHDDVVWPSLSNNAASRLQEKKSQPSAYPKIAEDDLKAFASAFASGLNL